MQGRRLPDAVLGEPGPGWEAWEGRGPFDEENPRRTAPAGSYMKVMPAGDGVVWWYIVAPDGAPGTLAPDTHHVEEHEDGTITVSPSILYPTPHRRMVEAGVPAIAGPGWHGWLERGVWKACP